MYNLMEKLNADLCWLLILLGSIYPDAKIVGRVHVGRRQTADRYGV